MFKRLFTHHPRRRRQPPRNSTSRHDAPVRRPDPMPRIRYYS
jgi:hypothetical protein